MTGSAGRYAELSAVVRSLKGELLSKERIRRLVESGSFSETVNLLTSGQLTFADGEELISIESFLIQKLVRLVGKLAEFAPHDSRALIRLMANRYEMDCLKQILKSIMNHVESQNASRHIMPAGKLTAERCKELLETRNPSRVLDVLEDENLKRTISARIAEKDELAAIASVDQYYYRKLWSASSLPDPLDAQSARRLIIQQIDHLNILFALRARLVGLDSRATHDLLIPVGYAGGISLNELAEATSFANLMRAVDKTPYGNAFQGRSIAEGDVVAVEHALNQNHAQSCLNAFAGSPFNVGVAVAILFLKDYELQDMLSVINGKANNTPNERIVDSLIL
jgi:vacuolar-type H+-ATPase subunit C/Vma6